MLMLEAIILELRAKIESKLDIEDQLHMSRQ
jgi:hypothetical protein